MYIYSKIQTILSKEMSNLPKLVLRRSFAKCANEITNKLYKPYLDLSNHTNKRYFTIYRIYKKTTIKKNTISC